MSRNTQKLNTVTKFMKEEVYSDMTMTHFQLFMEVATNEGVTMKTLASKLDMLSGSLSRNMRTLGQYYGKVKGRQVLRGFDLVKYEPNKYDRRSLSCYLTDRGREVYSQIVHIMKSDVKIGGLYTDRIKSLLTSRRNSAHVEKTDCQQSCSDCQNTTQIEGRCRCLSRSK
jgi:DNA-binding MarR family transcriptional regulator